MNKLLALLAVTTAVVTTAPAFAADVTAETKTSVKESPDGSMKKEVSATSTDAAGTTTKAETEVKKDVSSDGSTDTSVVKETSTDPKGLGNKETTKTKDEVKVDAKSGKTKHKHKKVVNGKTTENKSTETAPAANQAIEVPSANPAQSR